LCALALVATSTLAGAASSKVSAARISAHLTKRSFTSAQAKNVKLIYKLSAPSKSFSYRLTFKKGAKWQNVKRVKKTGNFSGTKSMTVKKVFAKKPVKVGSYRLKLSADGGSTRLSFKVVNAKSIPTVSKPANTGLPTISGTTKQGQALTASNGSWSHSPTSYAYQWRRCNSSGAICLDISGATSSSRTLALADAGSTIRLVVTASNSAGSASATSSQTAVVSGLPPANTTLPAISGTTTQGQTLSASNGSWSNLPTSYAYQWRRCNASGANCADISSATASAYTLVYADAGSTTRVVVTASNAYGDSTATSSQTIVAAGLPPANTAIPVISGTTGQGQTLSVSNGSWTNVPTSYAYQWRRCDGSGENCTNISTATASTYILASEDVGSTIRAAVTASNTYGDSSAATSGQTVVVGVAPANTALPTISGTKTQGQTLTAAYGSWTNVPTSYAYQWRRCDGSGEYCTNISSATASTYVLVLADVTSTIRVVVTASNTSGSSSPATSIQTAVIAGLPPANTALPTISGVTTVGYELTASNGSWANTPPTSYAYQWRRCSSPTSCADISSATSGTYVLAPADGGLTIRVVVIATNPYGASTPATSGQTALIED
jgi:hypothetical protein